MLGPHLRAAMVGWAAGQVKQNRSINRSRSTCLAYPTEALDKALQLKPNHPRDPDRRTKPKSSPEEDVFGQQAYHIGNWHFRGMFAVLVVGKILSIPCDGESRPRSYGAQSRRAISQT